MFSTVYRIYLMRSMHSLRFFSIFIIFFVALAGCSSNKNKNDELTEQEYYQQAQHSMAKKNYSLAIERLKKLESRYPFGRYGEQAQLELMYSYYKVGDHSNVLAIAERFIRLHPLHDQVDYAYYMRGLAAYSMGFSFVERFFKHDVARRDPTPMRDAFYYFAELVERFPNSAYVGDAQAHMIYIKERLASYEIAVTRYLMKRHSFLAAANRATTIVENYQRTPSVPEALALQVEAFRYLEMPEESEKALAILQYNYPDYRQFKKGEFVESGLAQTDRRSWLNIVSFGLLDNSTRYPQKG